MDAHPLKLAYARQHPGELAAWLAARGPEAMAEALDGLPADAVAPLLARLPQGPLDRVLAEHDDEHVIRWLNAANADHALTLLLHVEAPRRSRVLAELSSGRKRRTLERLLIYPRGTVGALVNPAALRLEVTTPLAEAVTLLRADTPEPDTPVWLVDSAGFYQGLLDLGGALIAESESLTLRSFLVPVKALRAETGLLDARRVREWLAHSELPVVDHRNHLLGTLSRARLMAALKSSPGPDTGIADGLGELTRQYFRVLGTCLGDLFGPGGRR
jgi:Mg/Co/Ni transporter MgtE